MRQITLTIGGMSCHHCVRAVRDALADMPGVTVDDVTIGSVSLHVDPTVATVDRLVAAISDAGYNVLEPVPW